MTAVASNQFTAVDIQDLIEEIEWLTGYRSPESILTALGYRKAASLTRRLHNAGRPDLAHPFEHLAQKEKYQQERAR
jgi:hypothetical protein